MLVAEDEKGLILWNKRTWHFCLHWENMFIVPKYCTCLYIQEP